MQQHGAAQGGEGPERGSEVGFVRSFQLPGLLAGRGDRSVSPSTVDARQFVTFRPWTCGLREGCIEGFCEELGKEGEVMLKLKKLKAEADAKKALETEAAAAGKKAVAKTSAGELILQKGGRCSAEDRAQPLQRLLPLITVLPSLFCPAEVGDLKDVESEQIVVNFPDPDNLMCCEITIKPGELPDRGLQCCPLRCLAGSPARWLGVVNTAHRSFGLPRCCLGCFPVLVPLSTLPLSSSGSEREASVLLGSVLTSCRLSFQRMASGLEERSNSR